MKILLPAVGPAGTLRWGRSADLARYLRSASPDGVQARSSDTLKDSVLTRRIPGVSWPPVYRNISPVSSELLSRMQQLRLDSAAYDLVAREYHLARSVAGFDRRCRGVMPSNQN